MSMISVRPIHVKCEEHRNFGGSSNGYVFVVNYSKRNQLLVVSDMVVGDVVDSVEINLFSKCDPHHVPRGTFRLSGFGPRPSSARPRI